MEHHSFPSTTNNDDTYLQLEAIRRTPLYTNIVNRAKEAVMRTMFDYMPEGANEIAAASLPASEAFDALMSARRFKVTVKGQSYQISPYFGEDAMNTFDVMEDLLAEFEDVISRTVASFNGRAKPCTADEGLSLMDQRYEALSQTQQIGYLKCLLAQLISSPGLDNEEGDMCQVFEEYQWEPLAGVDQVKYRQLHDKGMAGDLSKNEAAEFVGMVSASGEKHQLFFVQKARDVLHKDT